MHSFANWVLWIYIVLLVLGGLLGFLKAKSKVSLVTSLVFGALLALTTVPKLFQPESARIMATLVMAVLMLVFTVRLGKTKKFMPSGVILMITIVAFAVWNISFYF